MENYIVINGKKAELTEEQLENLGIKVEKDIFEPKDGDQYYLISNSGCLCTHNWDGDGYDIRVKEVGNCCTDRDIIQQRAWHETLDRLLWRFSMQNGMDKIIWSGKHTKYYITYVTDDNRFSVGCAMFDKGIEIYFLTEEIAQKAIDTIVKPFIEEHPDFVW